MAKKHDQKYYLKQCAKTLEEIRTLSPDAGFVFLRLKKKAQKYLKKAQEMEKKK